MSKNKDIKLSPKSLTPILISIFSLTMFKFFNLIKMLYNRFYRLSNILFINYN